MSQAHENDLTGYLNSGRQLLQQAAARYERSLAPDEYWWMGVGLAASTLAELSGNPHATGRLEQLIDRLGYKGAKGDWVQRFMDELADLDAQGLLWPIYEKRPDGELQRTEAPLHARFDGESAYFLALAHIATAVAHRRGEAMVAPLAEAIVRLVEAELTPDDEALILRALATLA